MFSSEYAVLRTKKMTKEILGSSERNSDAWRWYDYVARLTVAMMSPLASKISVAKDSKTCVLEKKSCGGSLQTYRCVLDKVVSITTTNRGFHIGRLASLHMINLSKDFFTFIQRVVQREGIYTQLPILYLYNQFFHVPPMICSHFYILIIFRTKNQCFFIALGHNSIHRRHI